MRYNEKALTGTGPGLRTWTVAVRVYLYRILLDCQEKSQIYSLGALTATAALMFVAGGVR